MATTAISITDFQNKIKTKSSNTFIQGHNINTQKLASHLFRKFI